jgi:hypothetical protein
MINNPVVLFYGAREKERQERGGDWDNQDGFCKKKAMS